MTPCTVTLELADNSRVIDGIMSVENYWTTDFGFKILPCGNYSNCTVETTLKDLDFGRYDAEGYSYICKLLNIVPGDLINAWIEE